MSGGSESLDPIREFSEAPIAPTGEWWGEFSVGLALQERDISLGDRRIDGLCVTSRPNRPPQKLSRAETREKRSAGWLDGEDVVLVEHGVGDYAWAKYGELDVRRRMFEMDWPNLNVEKYILLMDVASTRVNEDTAWIFEHELEDYDYIVKAAGTYYDYQGYVTHFG